MKRKSLDVVETITDDPRRAEITLKAVTTIATDEGTFEAVISTEGIDREKDVVSAAGMVAALRKWNRPIPLSWNHSITAEDIFGNIDSQTAREVASDVAEVAVKGQVDLDSKVGAEAWRSFKSRSIGFSFGYMILASTKRAGGGRHITELDIFEVTATPTPMNNGTRVLSTKAIEDQLRGELQEVKARLEKVEKALEDQEKQEDVTDKETKSRSVDPLQDQAMKTALGVLSDGAQAPEVVEEEPKREPEDPETLRKASHDLMVSVLSGAEVS